MSNNQRVGGHKAGGRVTIFLTSHNHLWKMSAYYYQYHIYRPRPINRLRDQVKYMQLFLGYWDGVHVLGFYTSFYCFWGIVEEKFSHKSSADILSLGARFVGGNNYLPNG